MRACLRSDLGAKLWHSFRVWVKCYQTDTSAGDILVQLQLQPSRYAIEGDRGAWRAPVAMQNGSAAIAKTGEPLACDPTGSQWHMACQRVGSVEHRRAPAPSDPMLPGVWRAKDTVLLLNCRRSISHHEAL